MGIRGFLLFLKGISQKVNVIAWLNFELYFFRGAIQHLSHDATETISLL